MGKPGIEPIARGLVRRGDCVLVCRNLEHGHCYLPGGHIEFGEGATDALAREFMEEAGLSVEVGALLAVAELRFHQRRRERHELGLVFHVKPGTPEGFPENIASMESDIAFEWVPLSRLKEAHFKPAPLLEWLRTASERAPTAWLSFDERSTSGVDFGR